MMMMIIRTNKKKPQEYIVIILVARHSNVVFSGKIFIQVKKIMWIFFTWLPECG